MRARLPAVSCFGAARPADPAAAQHRGGVAQRADLVQLVADVEDAAALGGEPAQRLEQLQHRLRRQHRGRLVHDQQLRASAAGSARSRRAGARRPTCCAPGGAGRSAGRSFPTPRGCARRAGPARSRSSSASEMFSATVSVSNSEKCWNTMPMPSRRASAGLAIVHRPAFPQRCVPASGLGHAVDDLHQRALAGAVLAQHGVDLAGAHLEVDVVVRDHRRIALGDAAQDEARLQLVSGRLSRTLSSDE